MIEEFSFRGGGGSVSDQWSGAEVLGPYENQDLAEIAKFRAAGSERDPQRSG